MLLIRQNKHHKSQCIKNVDTAKKNFFLLSLELTLQKQLIAFQTTVTILCPTKM